MKAPILKAVGPRARSASRNCYNFWKTNSLSERATSRAVDDSNLVDPASSHMLVSKTKPCMSKYKYYTAKLRMAH
jgi:hypothetical protein